MTQTTPAGQFLCPHCGSDAEANIRTTLSVPMVESTHPWDPVAFSTSNIATPAVAGWNQTIFRDSSPFQPFYWRPSSTTEA